MKKKLYIEHDALDERNNMLFAPDKGNESSTSDQVKSDHSMYEEGQVSSILPVPQSLHIKVFCEMDLEAMYIMQLARLFGFRLKEAAHFDANKALEVHLLGQPILLLENTKNDNPRRVLVNTVEKLACLCNIAQYQQLCNKSTLIPAHLSYDSFRKSFWKKTNAIDLQYNIGGERKSFACDLYLLLVGALCPLQSGIPRGIQHYQYIATQLNISPAEAIVRDTEARLEIAKWLGHRSIESTYYYLG
ncbi:hypothetical protein [Vibrio alfacsensis]|uniref:hypothetical protein n=1 Tax=Vibrio alfacsensis TaxID=1074311 RepID=UPI004067D72B